VQLTYSPTSADQRVCKLRLFADDVNMYATFDVDLEWFLLSKQCSEWPLNISIKKSAAVYFHLKINTLQEELNLKLRDDLLLTVNYVKNLVVLIDDYVELNSHINYVVNATLNKFSFTLRVTEAFFV